MLNVFSMYGTPGATQTLTSTDVAQSLPAALLTSTGKSCKAIMFTIETNSIKFAFGGATPVQAAGNLGHIILKDQAPMYFVGVSMISTLKYISAVAATAGKIQVTPFY